MAFERYREFARRLYPTVLNGYWGERLSGVVSGVMFDLVAGGLAEAVQAPWLRPDQPEDALELLARERSLPRYLRETVANWRARLQSAWEIWERGGSHAEIESQYAAALYLGTQVYSPLEWTRTPLNHPSQFWVYVPETAHDGLLSPGEHAGNPATIAGQHLCGINGPTEVVVELRQIAQNFRPGNVVCRQIIVEISGSTCGTGLLAGAHTCGGVQAFIGTGIAPS